MWMSSTSCSNIPNVTHSSILSPNLNPITSSYSHPYNSPTKSTHTNKRFNRLGSSQRIFKIKSFATGFHVFLFISYNLSGFKAIERLTVSLRMGSRLIAILLVSVGFTDLASLQELRPQDGLVLSDVKQIRSDWQPLSTRTNKEARFAQNHDNIAVLQYIR